MQKFKSLNSYSTPTFWSWSTAALAAALTILSAVMIHVVSEGVSLYLTYHELRAAVLLKSSDVEVQELLGRMNDMHASPVSNLVMKGMGTTAEQERRSIISTSMRSVLTSLMSRNYDLAGSVFDDTSKSARLSLLNLLGGNREAVASLERVGTDLSALINRRKSIESLEKEALELIEQLKLRVNQFTLVSTEFGELMSLVPIPASDPVEPLPIYESGALEGTPVLKGIADGSTTLLEVREAMSKAGGNVKLSGPNVSELFNTRLVALRQTTEAIKAEHDALRIDLSEKKAEIESASAALKEETISAKSSVTLILVTSMEPQIGLFASDLYNFLANLTENLQFLPKLPRITTRTV